MKDPGRLPIRLVYYMSSAQFLPNSGNLSVLSHKGSAETFHVVVVDCESLEVEADRYLAPPIKFSYSIDGSLLIMLC